MTLPPRRIHASSLAIALGALGLLAACGGGERARTRTPELDALERLAFVPPGECELVARFGASFVVCETTEALLVDRYEVTRAEVLEWLDGASAELAPELRTHARAWTAQTLDWPASSIALDEARAFATARGERLPTASEWLRIACGTHAQPWPWGPSDIVSAANSLPLQLDRPCPVGTFEHGRTPFGTYDMLGNVWEWVDAPLAAPGADPAWSLGWAMGGSYASHQRRLYDYDVESNFVLNRIELDPRARAADVGFRCVAEAAAWLRGRASAIEAESDAPARLARIGASWGGACVPYLDRFAAETSDTSFARVCAWLREGARP